MSHGSSPQSSTTEKAFWLSHSWPLLLKFVVSGLLIWFLLRNRDLGVVYQQVQGADAASLVTAGTLLLAVALPTALRWSYVLTALGAPTRVDATLPPVLIGNFFNQGLPSTIGGDAFRAWEISLASDVRLPLALSSVAIDRLAGFVALFMLVSLMVPALFAMVPSQIVFMVLLLLVMGYTAIGVLMALDLFHGRLARFRLARGLAQFSADMRRVLLSPVRAAPVLACGLLNIVGSVFALYVLARGLGIHVSLTGCFAVVPFAALVAAVPISIAGWGVREGAFVAGFGFLGIADGDALILSVLFGLTNMVASLPGGVVWLTRKRSIRAGARPVPAGDSLPGSEHVESRLQMKRKAAR
jgi:uncharacterized protein (TIRG00374 family)